MTQVHADPVRGEPECDGLDPYGAASLAVGGGEEERGLVGHVLESVDVQRFPGFLRHVLVRRPERPVLVPGQGEGLVDLRRGLAVRGSGPVDEAAAYRVTSDLVAGQQPSGDVGGGPDGIVGDRDAVGLLDPYEVVRLDVGAEGATTNWWGRSGLSLT